MLQSTPDLTIWGFFKGLFKILIGLSLFLQSLLFLILMLVIFGIVGGIATEMGGSDSSGPSVKVPEGAALVLNPVRRARGAGGGY